MSTEAQDCELVEERLDRRIPALVHAAWSSRMPWLVQGTSTRGSNGDPFDLGLFTGVSPEDRVRGRWNRMLAEIGLSRAVVARQVHEDGVLLHRAVASGIDTSGVCDGHVTDQPDVLLAVTVADCVPVFLVAPATRAVAVVHAGWRGAAAGVLERGLSVLVDRCGAAASDVLVHLGPSICGACYEVGPEVFEALGQEVPRASRPIDLRGILARRAAAAGIPGSNTSISTHCTRCTGSGLFSHRAGDRQRQVGYVGIRS